MRDLGRALEQYEPLAFATHPYRGAEQYGFADRDGFGLHLSEQSDHDPGRAVRATYLNVGDADALYEEWIRPGVAGVTQRVHLSEYRLREGARIDPDGNLIRFGSPVDANDGSATDGSADS